MVEPHPDLCARPILGKGLASSPITAPDRKPALRRLETDHGPTLPADAESVLDAPRRAGIFSLRQVATGRGAIGLPAVRLLRRIPSRFGGSEAARLMGSVRLTLLDGFELRDRTGLLAIPVSAQRVLAFVALHDEPVLRRYVASRLWVDSNEEHATSSLRSALWRIRNAGCDAVEVVGSRIRLARDAFVAVCDTSTWCRPLLWGETSIDVRAADRHIPRGELLPDWCDDWVLFERDRLGGPRAAARDALSERLIRRGSLVEALRIARQVVKLEPLRESAHRQLIRI